MTRKALYDLIKAVYPTYFVGQHKGECKTLHVVIKYKGQIKSVGNGGCGWQYVDIMVYAPHTSALGIEEALTAIRTVLKEAGLEPTGLMTPDFLDTEKLAIMRSEEYRLPKELQIL